MALLSLRYIPKFKRVTKMAKIEEGTVVLFAHFAFL